MANDGFAATTGKVTLTGIVPAGLTALTLGGPGWSCQLATTTGTRTSPLAAGEPEPDHAGRRCVGEAPPR